ncbi:MULTISPECIES: hypothetical protein [unclassified Paenibacillus]|uniref:hypothetical protein n=1 Tax=unclassified Paenibacillus TaxID=185978 RepID=UPI001AE3EE26|nr:MULTISPECIES: hypothetical protein [unclassified Paenibacillus]MBP1154413.1 hypothetical protein [Paenibacillus sp. PvP091]MBP1170203.1 hypothetical protein [Paenibacillus sp. PvR098]MBP2441231.1 hypothetical protein [Paenibacillus sp. PvP052]
MKKKIYVSLIAVTVLAGAGYAGYKYTMNLAAKSISNMLANEDFSNIALSDSILSSPVQDNTITPADPSTSPKSPAEKTETSTQAPEGSSTVAAASPTPASQSTQKNKSQAGTAQSNKLAFKSKEDAIKFAMSRFSASEIKHLQGMVSGGITQEIKQELKRIAFSKFTREEIEAVRRAVQ